MLNFLEYIISIVGNIILAFFVFTGIIVGVIFLLVKEDSKTKKY